MTHVDDETTTISPVQLKLLLMIMLCIAIGLMVIIGIFLFVNPPLPSQSNISQKNLKQFTSSSAAVNPVSNQSSTMMTEFMRSIYVATTAGARRKRQLNFPYSSLSLSDDMDSIISLSSQYNRSHYYFAYHSSLENLTHVELILPIQRVTQLSTMHINFNSFNLSFKQPFQLEKNWLKINLTQYIQFVPVAFFIQLNQISLQSSPFLTLYFRRSSPAHTRHRRALSSSSSFSDNAQLVTYPNDPFYCQVRPLRTSFAELNWTSWIIEPSSYEMNVCSGTCHSSSNMPPYFKMQNLLHQISPKKMPRLCCQPKRFSSTILLYYDGPNLILKRHDNMRVVECGCS